MLLIHCLNLFLQPEVDSDVRSNECILVNNDTPAAKSSATSHIADDTGNIHDSSDSEAY